MAARRFLPPAIMNRIKDVLSMTSIVQSPDPVLNTVCDAVRAGRQEPEEACQANGEGHVRQRRMRPGGAAARRDECVWWSWTATSIPTSSEPIVLVNPVLGGDPGRSRWWRARAAFRAPASPCPSRGLPGRACATSISTARNGRSRATGFAGSLPAARDTTIWTASPCSSAPTRWRASKPCAAYELARAAGAKPGGDLRRSRGCASNARRVHGNAGVRRLHPGRPGTAARGRGRRTRAPDAVRGRGRKLVSSPVQAGGRTASASPC